MATKYFHWAHFGPILLPMAGNLLHWEHLNKQHDMKNYKAYLLFLSLGLLMLSACERPGKDIVCNISGTAVGFSGQFVITAIDGDPRQPLAKVEIQPDGSFPVHSRQTHLYLIWRKYGIWQKVKAATALSFLKRISFFP